MEYGILNKENVQRKPSQSWIIGIHEAGETVWETVARGCLTFLEFTKEMATTCTVHVRKGSACCYAKK
jgi:hypothetical protein